VADQARSAAVARGHWRKEVERAVRPALGVMAAVDEENVVEVAAADQHGPVSAGAARPALDRRQAPPEPNQPEG
jgi:hypothetical protein